MIVYVIFLIMKQKRFKDFVNIGIGYQSWNGRYIHQHKPQKSHIGRTLHKITKQLIKPC